MNELLWISPALLAGVVALRLGLPPMVGYLLCGFLLNTTGAYDHERLSSIGDLGVTLLLFTVGVKLDLRSLFRPAIWAGTTLHSLAIIVSVTALVTLIASTGLSLFSGIGLAQAVLIAFAMSFSSTVFAVKTLEDKGDYQSGYGKVAISVLVMQDIFAVIFLAGSKGAWPSIWALTLLALIPGRLVLVKLLEQAAKSRELLLIYGIALAYGSYFLFEEVQVKGDLGALLVGSLLASHPLGGKLSDRLTGLKDLLLVGFFLSIGLSGNTTVGSLVLALFFACLVVFKGGLFFFLFTRFKMRARTAALSSLLLSNYSEFGLIVGAVAVAKEWLSEEWLVTLALSLTISIVAGSPLLARAEQLFGKYRTVLRRYESDSLQCEERHPDFGPSQILVVGMGRLGSSVFEQLESQGYQPLGLDNDPQVVLRHQSAGRAVVQADATDTELWESTVTTSVEIAIVTFKRQNENLCIVSRAKAQNKNLELFAVAEHPDEVASLKAAGARSAWNLFSEAGVGLVAEVLNLRGELEPTKASPQAG